ncbi:MAG: phosphoribosylaminoimidazolesuccinocarboxamide synthase, partial [Candidatus Omnitrophica bacterium]|nr:phosphoribosylaminoimidazolesuccinocarboxamide synthase [Candidatus Omnitrophota bacterium]
MGAMIYQTEFKELKLFKAGKVRDVYDLGDKLLIVATDRISCFDVVLPTPIPDKGKILTQISLFWFSYLKEIINNHIVTTDIKDLPPSLEEYKDILKNRFMIVKKCEVIPFECVVRGYVSGSAWGEYKKKGSVCGVELPSNLREGELLEQPLFTPATKAASGHDENVG